MGILAGIVAWLGKGVASILETELLSLITSGISWLKDKWAKKQKLDQIETDAKARAQKLEDAKTADEIDKGIDDILG